MKKSPVVLLHGMWSTPDTLADLKAVFVSEGYEVHVPRLPFHHEKSKLTEQDHKHFKNSRVQDYVTHLWREVKKLDAPPILVGHSMGGLLAQLIAMRIDCEKLILISSAAPAGINSWSWSVIRTFGHNLFKMPLWQQLTNLSHKNIAYGIANTQPLSIQQDILESATFESGMVSTQIGMWFMFREPATRVYADRIRCPILVIGGTEDKITPIKVQQKIVKKYEGRASLKVVTGACHWTIGGSYFSAVTDTMFEWLGQHNEMKAA